jgi:hypothetical protein
VMWTARTRWRGLLREWWWSVGSTRPGNYE